MDIAQDAYAYNGNTHTGSGAAEPNGLAAALPGQIVANNHKCPRAPRASHVGYGHIPTCLPRTHPLVGAPRGHIEPRSAPS